MKESRFIELLNLYIDQQISPEEAAELEAEIARSPAHRRTYLQYCRMHRACTRLFENFHAPAAPLAQALHQADGKITAFPARRFRFTRAAGAVGLAVAAACIAFVLTEQTALQTASQPSEKPAVALTQVSVPPESFQTVAAKAYTRQPEFQTVFTASKFSRAGNHSAVDAQREAFDWMNQIALSPMPADNNTQAVFGPQFDAPSSNLRFQRALVTEQPAAEMTAFKFQR